jgi:putative ABC transport system substrate-binding protein
MRRRSILTSALVSGLISRTAAAQAPARPMRIGWLTAQRPESLAYYLEALRQGLSDLGYEPGRNLVIEYRYGNDSLDRVPEMAAELARLPVDLIVVQGAAVAVVGKLGLPVPVVYTLSGDPVSSGLADSLARPRGNMTGITFMAAELNAKRLELLRDIVPGLRRVALVANPQHAGEHLERASAQQTAQLLGLELDYYPARSADELASAMAAMVARPPQGVSLFADGFAIQHRQTIIDAAMSCRAPLISGWAIFARSGAICTYGPRLEASYRRLAYFIDRVLNGAKPSDLPIEQPTTFELIVNLKTASALGITIPPSILALADEVIE